MAMVSSSRPSLRSTSGRFVRSSPNPPEPHVTSVSTRANRIALRPVHDTSTTPQPLQNLPDTPAAAVSARNTTRGHPHRHPAQSSSAEVPDHEAPRPPTKITVTQPHGQLIRTTNGVQRRINITEDGITSQASTPRPDSVNGARTPANGKLPAESRSLRSKDVGSRLKSELSKFFPEYDDVMNDVPESPEFLKLDEPILITNEPLRHSTGNPPARQSNGPHTTVIPSEPSAIPESKPEQNARTIGLTSFPTPTSDPLPDSLYFKPHRRKEYAEKRLRNREKENALHEKSQLERVLEDLQGPDWLRALGVTGITEGERKSFEWKRAYFIGEVKSLLNKFRAWKEEEKRLKTEREEALARQEEEDENGSERDADASSGDMPPSSDIDAWATRQLLQEASQASGGARSKGKAKARPLKRPSKPPDDTDESPRSTRSSKRGADRPLFFGVPIPELKKREFALPPDLISDEALRAHARKRRKLRRDLQQALREKDMASSS